MTNVHTALCKFQCAVQWELDNDTRPTWGHQHQSRKSITHASSQHWHPPALPCRQVGWHSSHNRPARLVLRAQLAYRGLRRGSGGHAACAGRGEATYGSRALALTLTLTLTALNLTNAGTPPLRSVLPRVISNTTGSRLFTGAPRRGGSTVSILYRVPCTPRCPFRMWVSRLGRGRTSLSGSGLPSSPRVRVVLPAAFVCLRRREWDTTTSQRRLRHPERVLHRCRC